jgi:hypothetical protein
LIDDKNRISPKLPAAFPAYSQSLIRCVLALLSDKRAIA